MTPALKLLPDLLRTAYDVGGIEVVRKLANAFGGRVIYIPVRENLADNHLLVQVAGRDVAHALCEERGRHVEFPRAQSVLRKVLVKALSEPREDRPRGDSHNEVAAILGCTNRRVRQIREELKGDTALAGALAGRVPPPKKDARQIDLEDYLQAPAKLSRR